MIELFEIYVKIYSIEDFITIRIIALILKVTKRLKIRRENMKKNIKHLTLLHSNDLHGDFLAEEIDSNLIGGVSLLSGYINQVRRKSKNSLYMIAGDMFRGSLIDTEFQGISTIEIMNKLAPDIVALGNHELDYGIAHLLFLERCCKFPIVNSNIYIKSTGLRLFNSHKIIHIDGMNILVMGMLTEEIMTKAKTDVLLGTFVDLSDAAHEVGIICNSHKDTDIDFTILLTHIGHEQDIELAKKLDPSWGVDVIIGGHSHTLLEEPVNVNNILIVQAGVGTNQIGHFEIDIDTDKNAVDQYSWKTVAIDAEHCVRNDDMENFISNYKKITDAKYGTIITHLVDKATHPDRYMETTVGNLFCDALKNSFDLDIVMIGSGSLRAKELGPTITLGNLLDMYSYDEALIKVELTGKQLKDGLHRIIKDSITHELNINEYYQLSEGVSALYHTKEDELTILLHGEPMDEQATYSIGMEDFHYTNIDKFLGIQFTPEQQRHQGRTITNNIRIAVEEYLKEQLHLFPKLEGRTGVR